MLREGLAAGPTPNTQHEASAMPVSSGADANRIDQREHGREQSADKFDQAGAHQVAHAFHVGHDARHQRAGLVGVVVGHRQPADVLLNFAPQLGDQPLRLLGQQLREGK